jgi:outer membrane lipoprotein-sorting protein
MAGMAGTPGVVARFREVKELALLSAPLESRGTLYFAPPDRLARIVEQPGPSRLVIDGERLLFHDAAGGDEVDLSGHSIAREYVSNFIVLFNGDLDALQERYTPTFHADGRAWSLELRPRRRPLADFVERVTLQGEGRVLQRMELVESDGDRTTTWFEEVEIDHRFGTAESERVFALPEPTADRRSAPDASDGP